MSSAVRTLVALGAIAVLGVFDAIVTPRLVFTPMLGVVVALSAWHVGARVGIGIALAAGAARFVADLTWHASDPLTAWNALAWSVAFVGLALMVSRARARGDAVAALET